MRPSDGRFVADVRRANLARRVFVALAAVAIVAIVALVAACLAFMVSVSAKLSLGDSNVSESLVAATAAEPYYVLLAADLDTGAASFSPDAIVLARVDESASLVTLVSIPANTRVQLSDGNRHQLRDAISIGGDAELVDAVASFAGVSISHYARIDAEGISSLVDFLGGVSLEVIEDVDDPAAGSIFIEAGERTLSGSESLVLLRATNYVDGTETQAAQQLAFVAAVAQQLFFVDGFERLQQLDGASAFVSTDLDVLGALAVAEAFGGWSAASVLTGRVPGYETTSDDVDYFIAYTSSWASMMELVEAGEDPSLDESAESAASVDPSSFEITVRNGYGITGAAAEIAEALTAAGFQVAETGNADSYVYDETLIVYQDDEYEAAANAVAQALGVGRVIASNSFYVFDTQVLVVLGNDWKPTS